MAIKFEQLPNPIEAGQIIRAGHVSQSLVAFSGLDAYDINLSGSFAMTGSIYHTEIDDAAGIASSVLVRDNTTGEYYTTGSYGGGGGAAGSSGSSGTSGADGSSGSSGTSGVGTDGSSGSSGTSGVGTDGSSGSSGTSGVGTDGSSGSSGTSGAAGSSGSSGTSGAAGSSGSSGTSGLLSNQPIYDIGNHSTSGPGTSVAYEFIAGSTLITFGSTSITVGINEIANLSFGNQVHITATAMASETLSSANIVVEGNGSTLPNTLNSSGEIKFTTDASIPAGGLYLMYHVMYTEDEIG